MSALRDEIRAILREEIAALRTAAGPAVPAIERVRIASSGELNRFAQDLVRRAEDPEFSARIARGDLMFDLVDTTVTGVPMVSGQPRRAPEAIDKSLITERDIAGFGSAVRSLRIGPGSRLTPLARDEARRRGIRIERAER